MVVEDPKLDGHRNEAITNVILCYLVFFDIFFSCKLREWYVI